MKTNYFKAQMMFFIIGLLTMWSQSSFADNKIITDEPEQLCSPSTVLTLYVTLAPDCIALENCEWEVLVFDVSDCTQDTPLLVSKIYTYNQTLVFLNLTFNNNKVKVCVRQKPGSSCNEPNYAPKCVCRNINGTTMDVTIDICTP